MRGMAALLILGLYACGDDRDPASAPPVDAPQSTVAGAPVPTKAALIAVPGDKAELQRLIDLGYTVHDDHLHPPGAKECPLMGGDMVQ